MALKSFVSDQNPQAGRGLKKLFTQSDLKFQKSRKLNKSLRVHVVSQKSSSIITYPDVSKSSQVWDEAMRKTQSIVKSMPDTCFYNELDFPKFRDEVVDNFRRQVCIPAHISEVAATELRKSRNVPDLKYRLSLLVKSFSFAKIK